MTEYHYQVEYSTVCGNRRKADDMCFRAIVGSITIIFLTQLGVKDAIAQKLNLRDNIKAHVNAVNCLAFSPDGKTLASGGTDGKVKLWKTDNGHLARTFAQPTSAVMSVAFSPDGKRIAICDNSSAITIIDLSDGSIFSLDRKKYFGGGMAFSPDGESLASGCSGAAPVNPMKLIFGIVLVVALLLLASFFAGWHMRTRRLLKLGFPLAPEDRKYLIAQMRRSLVCSVLMVVLALCLVSWLFMESDFRNLTTAEGAAEEIEASKNTIRMWKLATGEVVKTLNGPKNEVSVIEFSPDGERIAVGSYGEVALTDIATGRVTKIFENIRGDVFSVAFSPDGKTIAAPIWRDLKVWSVDNGNEISCMKGHPQGAMSLVFIANGRTIASAGIDGDIRLWDAASGRNVFTVEGHESPITSVAVSPNGKL